MDEAHSSPGLHAAAGPGLAEQCATLVPTLSFTIFFRFVKKNKKQGHYFVYYLDRVDAGQGWRK